jgi:hypothetical protein
VTGSSPPYAVRFFPVKLYFVAALILWLSAGICKSGDLTGFSEIRHFG